MRCPCRKAGNLCSSFCECQNCINLKDGSVKDQEDDLSEEEDLIDQNIQETADSSSEDESTHESDGNLSETDGGSNK